MQQNQVGTVKQRESGTRVQRTALAQSHAPQSAHTGHGNGRVVTATTGTSESETYTISCRIIEIENCIYQHGIYILLNL